MEFRLEDVRILLQKRSIDVEGYGDVGGQTARGGGNGLGGEGRSINEAMMRTYTSRSW